MGLWMLPPIEISTIDYNRLNAADLPLFGPSLGLFAFAFLGALAMVGVTLYAVRTKSARRRKWTVRTALIFGGLIAVYILFRVSVNIVGDFRVASGVAELKRAGIRVTREEILTRDVRAEDNAEPYYVAAIKLMALSDKAENLRGLEDFSSWTDTDRRDVRQALADADIQRVLALSLQGASLKKLYFVRDENKPLLIEFEPDAALTLMDIRRAVCLLANAAMVLAGDGKNDQAYAYIDAIFAIGAQLDDQLFAYSRLIQMSAFAIGSDCLERNVRKHGVDTPRAENFIRRLSTIKMREKMFRALGDEIVGAEEVFVSLERGWPDFYGLRKVGVFFSPTFPGAPIWDRLAFAVWPFFRLDYAYYLHEMSRRADFLKKPYWEVKDAVRAPKRVPAMYPISKITLSASCWVTDVARVDSDIANVIQTLALEIYKNKHGAYPERLERLVPEILSALPLDPYTGKPFQYEKNGATYVLTCDWLEEKRARALKNRSK